MSVPLAEMGLTFLAGLVSVLSPCVLPVLPIILTGGQRDHPGRALLVVLGLALAFIAMGVLSALFGSLVSAYMPDIEQGAGIVIMLAGMALWADINPFKRLAFLGALAVRDDGGRRAGFLLGMMLGLIWIPCVGPVLSGVLARVAGRGDTGYAIGLLTLYAAGFSIPMLAVAYLSQGARKRLGFLQKHPVLVRIASGGILIAFGAIVASAGMLAFSF